MKRLEGRDEEILEPELAIVDAHHHLFDRPALRYMLGDYLADAAAGHKIVASVYVETQAMARSHGPELLRPLGEVEFANGVGAMADSGTYGSCRVGAGIVGYADLRFGESIGELLDRCMATAPERFRGIRQITIEDPSEVSYKYMTHRPPAGVMQHPGFLPGFAQLARRGLTFDAAVFDHQLADVARLAGAFPDTPIVLNHLGMAMGMEMDAPQRAEVFRRWRDALRELARHQNVVMKVGGLGMPFWGLGFEHRADTITSVELADAWRPYVETGIEAFGAQRCMMESNFPPDGRSCGFVPLWNALKRITRGCSEAEKAALFHGTAMRVYRIEIPSPDPA